MRISIISTALGMGLGALCLAVAGSASAASGYNSSKSNPHPPLVAPPAGAPASCHAAYKALDGNGDGKLDEGLQFPPLRLKLTDACIKDGAGAWGWYLKARMFSAQLKFNEAATAAGEAERAIAKQCPPNCRDLPPPDDVALFRANALSDAGRHNEALPIYDRLISKRPNDALLKQLRNNVSWPPPRGA